MTVSQIGSGRWAVGVGTDGRFSNRLLVQIDGRSVYSPLLSVCSGSLWILLEDVDASRSSAAPGRPLWGHAVNGVINIVTRKATSTRVGWFPRASMIGQIYCDDVRQGFDLGTPGGTGLYQGERASWLLFCR